MIAELVPKIGPRAKFVQKHKEYVAELQNNATLDAREQVPKK